MISDNPSRSSDSVREGRNSVENYCRRECLSKQAYANKMQITHSPPISSPVYSLWENANGDEWSQPASLESGPN